MNLIRRLGPAIAAAGLGIAALSGTGTALAAPAAPGGAARACPPNNSYVISDVHSFFVTNKGMATQTAGPGGVRLGLVVSRGEQVHGHITATGSYTVGGVVAQAKVTITVKLDYRQTASSTQPKKWTVPARWAVGWLAWGAKGYRFDWKRERTDSACHVEVVARGTGKLPAVPAFAHGMGIAPPETS